MEKKFIGLGVAAGLLAGITTYVFARVQLAPLISAAIAFEEEHSHAEELAGGHSHDQEVFTRSIQEGVGAATGTVAFAVVLGALFAVAFTVVWNTLRRRGIDADVRVVAMGVAVASFVALAVVPFLAYPGNPPGVGQSDSAGPRTTAYLIVVVASVALAAAAYSAALRLAGHVGGWQAGVVGVLGYLAAMTALVSALPTFNETPQGFPADVLAEFRVQSVVAQAVLWGVLGTAFALAMPRVLASDTQEAAYGGR